MKKLFIFTKALIYTTTIFLSFTGVTHAEPVPPEMLSNPRHYFEQCDPINISKAKEKMTREKVLKLCGGVEFPPLETIRNGFVFAIDEKRSAYITLPGWMPQNDQKIDFLCSKELVVLVYYDNQNNVTHVNKLPEKQMNSGKQSIPVITPPIK